MKTKLVRLLLKLALKLLKNNREAKVASLSIRKAIDQVSSLN